jgi:hypothetical protein
LTEDGRWRFSEVGSVKRQILKVIVDRGVGEKRVQTQKLEV